MAEQQEQGPIQAPQEEDVRKERAARKAEEEKSRIAQELLKKAEEHIEHKKLLEDADADFSRANGHEKPERIFLLVGSGFLIIVLPFLGYFSGIFLTLFAVVVSLIAGITSPKRSYSAGLNLVVSVVGLLYFEYAAVVQFHLYSWTSLFALYEVLALDFLLASYFSMVTYRRKTLEG